MKSIRFDTEMQSVGFGTNGIRDKKIFETAIKQGYRLFDSADLYQNSNILAEAIRDSEIHRDNFFINYKILPQMSKENFAQNIDEAVRKFSYVDCIMLHDMISNEGKEELKEKLRSIQPYLKEGKVKSLGVSNCQVALLKELIEEFPEIKFVQNAFSHVKKDSPMREFCKENAINYMGYEIFGGKGNVGACGGYQFQIYDLAWNVSAVCYPELSALSAKYGKTPQDLLLCWALQEGSIQIPSSTNPERMASNLAMAEFARSMPQDDKLALVGALRDKVLPVEWKKINLEAEQGDTLSQLKSIVGNSLPRHNLLASLYQAESLKYFMDLLLEYISNKYPGPNNDNYKSCLGHITISLCHFMEDCLKLGEDQYRKIIKTLDNIAKNSNSENEKDRLSELFVVMNSQEPPIEQVASIVKYSEQLDFFNKRGYFEIKHLELPPTSSYGLAFLGDNNNIYILKNISMLATLKDIQNLLAEHYPQDFKDSNLLESIYVPYVPTHINEGEHDVVPSDRINLSSLQYSPGVDVYGLAGHSDCQQLTNLFNSVYKKPLVFTNGLEILTTEVSPQSPAYRIMSDRLELHRLESSIKYGKEDLANKKIDLSLLKNALQETKQVPALDKTQVTNQEQHYQQLKESYKEDKQGLRQSEERYAKATSAYRERLMQAERVREASKDLSQPAETSTLDVKKK